MSTTKTNGNGAGYELSNGDLKRSINTLITSDPQNPAPNPFIVGRKPSQSDSNGKPAPKSK